MKDHRKTCNEYLKAEKKSVRSQKQKYFGKKRRVTKKKKLRSKSISTKRKRKVKKKIRK